MAVLRDYLMKNEELKFSFKLIEERVIPMTIESKRYYRVFQLFRIR